MCVAVHTCLVFQKTPKVPVLLSFTCCLFFLESHHQVSALLNFLFSWGISAVPGGRETKDAYTRPKNVPSVPPKMETFWFSLAYAF